MVASLAADTLGKWSFDDTSSQLTALAASNVIAGASVSGLTMNSFGGQGFDFAGLDSVPGSDHDGYGFGLAAQGVSVMFLHRANYYDGEGPDAVSYTSFGPGGGDVIAQGTAAGLGDGYAPISFAVTAAVGGEVKVESLSVSIAVANPGAALFVGFQEAGALVAGSSVLVGEHPVFTMTSKLNAPVVIRSGQTKTFTISLNSGSVDSMHNVNGFTLNGLVSSSR